MRGRGTGDFWFAVLLYIVGVVVAVLAVYFIVSGSNSGRIGLGYSDGVVYIEAESAES